MRKLVFATAAASLGLGLAVPALAQDRAPFTGPRVEALAGYDNIQDGGDGTSDGGRDGFVYGGALGYDVQAGRAVLGIEGEVTGSTIKARVRDLVVPGDRLRLDAGRDLYIGARAGFLASPRTLVYAKAGYTNARFTARYVNGAASTEDGTNLDGFRAGAGAEFSLSPNTYIKGEYRYSHYGEADGFDIDADRHQLLAGVGFRF